MLFCGKSKISQRKSGGFPSKRQDDRNMQLKIYMRWRKKAELGISQAATLQHTALKTSSRTY